MTNGNWSMICGTSRCSQKTTGLWIRLSAYRSHRSTIRKETADERHSICQTSKDDDLKDPRRDVPRTLLQPDQLSVSVDSLPLSER